MKNKVLSITIICTAALSITACANSDEHNASNESKSVPATSTIVETTTDTDSTDITDVKDFSPLDISVDGWKISVENVLIDTSLSHASTTLGYSNASTSTFEQDAKEGNQYVLIKMLITKDGSNENIEWANMKLSDSEGKSYSRIDDTFIEELGMKRMPGTTLNFGSYEGWFAYEIPETSKGLVLSYPFENQTMEYNFD